ncbi:MAG: DNA recombination protein RmuC [Elusimicrobia bacterium]|nr:DNA recombination protein RmuC [Elusimicrobiota bacterium]
MALDAVILILLVAVLAGVIALWRRDLKMDLVPVQDALAKLQADIASRIAQGTGDTKEAIANKFGEEFLAVWEKLEGQLSKNRQDQEARLTKTADSLEKRLEEIRNKVDERLLDIGNVVQKKLEQTMKEGFDQSQKVQEHLLRAEQGLEHLSVVGQSINELNSLLKLPHLRGSFGEMTLEALLADFLPATSYEIQKGAVGERRPDAIVKFPKNYLPIDSKFPREQVLPLFESSDPVAIEAARVELSRVVREQAKQIHEKYIRPDEGSMDMAFMFLPSETLYFEVIRNVSLWEQLSKLKVFPVSPNTLAVTLKGIAIAHDYYDMAQNMQKSIEDIRKARKHFEHFEGNFEGLGQRLRQAQDAFDTASTNLGRYSSSVTRLTGEEPPALIDGRPLPETTS